MTRARLHLDPQRHGVAHALIEGLGAGGRRRAMALALMELALERNPPPLSDLRIELAARTAEAEMSSQRLTLSADGTPRVYAAYRETARELRSALLTCLAARGGEIYQAMPGVAPAVDVPRPDGAAPPERAPAESADPPIDVQRGRVDAVEQPGQDVSQRRRVADFTGKAADVAPADPDRSTDAGQRASHDRKGEPDPLIARFLDSVQF